MFRVIVMSVSMILLAASAYAADYSRAIIHDIPQEELEKHLGKILPSSLTAADSAAIFARSFDADTLKVLAIMVEWTDRPGTYTQPTFDSMLFSRGVYPGGSMADYFDEVSYGKMTVIGDVIDWQVNGPYVKAWYYDFEPLLPVVDSFVDFSQYDGNNDGDVDAVIFIRSGTGEEDTQDPDDIWSFAFTYPLNGGPGPYDGKYISMWNTSPELAPIRDTFVPAIFTGSDTLNKIRVFCHELGHNLGLPDLYDYDDKLDIWTYDTEDLNDHPVYDWGLMGYYGYGLFSIGSTTPSHLCGWSKKELGWITETPLVGVHNDLEIINIETTDSSSLYSIPINPAVGEYFLLEFRNSQSSAQFDKVDSDFSVYFLFELAFGGEELQSGLIITHIYDSLTPSGIISNNGIPTYDYYGVVVEDVGYNSDSAIWFTDPDFRPSDSAIWWYPYETRLGAAFTSEIPGKESFDSTSTPNSDSYFGVTGIEVRVDSIVGDTLYAYVNNPLTDSDGDGWSDRFDNCPADYNPGQADADSNGVGDACDACTPVTWYEDFDDDGYGTSAVTVVQCDQPVGYVANHSDCDDTQASISPDGIEVCDGVDNDCNTIIDDDAVDGTTWYLDQDNDGFGSSIVSVIQCDQPPDYVADNTDCDDSNGTVNPAGIEVCDDVDNDCNSIIDDNAVDATTWYQDSDGDSFGNPLISIDQCTQPVDYVDNDLDCDDNDQGVWVCVFCCLSDRGNANNDAEDKANVADVSYMVAWLFGTPSGPPPVCLEEANANGDVEEKTNVADVSYLVAWLFGIPSGPPPPACP